MSLLREINVLRGAHRLAPVLGRSTGVMCKAVADWMRAEKGQFIGRLLAVTVPGYVAVYLSASRPWTWLVWGAVWFVGCCVIAALRGDFADISSTAAEGVEVSDTTPKDDQETAGEQHADHTPADADRTGAYLRQLVEHRVAVAVQPGRDDTFVRGKGVRLEDFLTELQTAGNLTGWNVKQFGALLKGVGVPVREQMYFKVAGRKANCPGVHVEDLTAALGRAPRLPAHLVPDLTPASPSLAADPDTPAGEVR